MLTTHNDTRIENYTEVTHALARHSDMLPSGEYVRAEVDNPRLDTRTPTYLRVSVWRKGAAFNLLETAAEYGLVCTDVWQLDAQHDDDTIRLKLEPLENKPLGETDE